MLGYLQHTDTEVQINRDKIKWFRWLQAIVLSSLITYLTI